MVHVVDIDESLAGRAADFLHENLSDRFDVATWRKLFEYPWYPDRPSSGVALLDDDRLVGVLGSVWSRRPVDGRLVTFCNICCWSVLPDYRRHSLGMLFRATGDEEVVTTNLTPSPAVDKLFRALQYSVLDTHKLFVLPGANALSAFRRPAPKMHASADAIEGHIRGESADVFRDHRGTISRHLLGVVGDRQCYVLYRRRVKKGLPFAEVLHVGDPALFVRHLERFLRRILFSTATPAMAIDSRFVAGRPVRGFPVRRTSYCLPRALEPAQIDNAYTELSVFPI